MKAIIPVAGLGTRLLPASKNIPKEMLPIVDKPSILYVVDEAVAAGIDVIIFVQGRGKHSIEDLFDVSFELEHSLKRAKKLSYLKTIQDIYNKVDIVSVRQKKPLGLGHAVYCARPVIGNEPFAVLLPDEIMIQHNTTKALISVYKKYEQHTVSVLKVDPSETSKYGIADVKPFKDDLYKVTKVVEKPKVSKSNWILPGRYVFTSEVFDIINDLPTNNSEEIGLAEALNTIALRKNLIAQECKSLRFDVGDKLGFLKANIRMSLEHSEISDGVKNYLKILTDKL